MDQKIKHLILGIVSFILFGAFLFFVPGVAKNGTQIKAVKFGLPLSFVQQDFSCKNSFAFYPRYFRFAPQERSDCPVKNFSPVFAVVSFLNIFLLVEVVIFLLEWAKFGIVKLWEKIKK